MFRLILKISLILLFSAVNAEPDAIDVTVDSELHTIDTAMPEIEDSSLLKEEELEGAVLSEIESESIEAIEELLPEATDIIDDVIENDVLDEDPLEAELQVEEITIGELSKDVVLVLDNSGSMKKNDPNFLVNKAVKEFISQQDENTRVGVVIFDQAVRLPVPLTVSSLANRELLLNSIENINYKGLFTDSPAGIERAIYELKNNGRDDAEKSIIFMTDGIVDTGAPEKDIEKSKWLREDLAPDAADNNIKIFGIAFTEEADFQLIQSISQKTDGEYYRALTVNDLQNVFEQINKIINTPPEPEPEPEPEIVQTSVEVPAPVIEQAPPAPVIIEVPVQSMGEEERIRSMIMIAAAIVLTLTLLGILILLLRRNRDLKAGEDAVAQEAYINDLQGKTDKQTHKLGTKPTMFGRVAGKDTDHLDYIVVNESTIGRRHALIEFKDYSYWIVDQGSINGTFVNGQPVSTEVRLKHGDRIRLHKCDFEFIMPEMEDSGMTVISNTVFAAQPAAIDDSEEATEIRDSDGVSMGKSDADMDFDITGAASAGELSDLYEPDPDDEDTIIRDLPEAEKETLEPEFTLDEDDVDSEDETIMLDDDSDSDIDDDATLRKDDI
ncbi:MAG: VWA domain-containing protein [Proteobacteria bacterium]|nr:VWA domain-containing protein [Pseudomonadota bacterium]